jgi:hypothetical protein
MMHHAGFVFFRAVQKKVWRAFAFSLLILCCRAFPQSTPSLLQAPTDSAAIASPSPGTPSEVVSQSKCSPQFPYTATEFIEKFTIAASAGDRFNVPKIFEETFGVKLQGTRSSDGRTFHLGVGTDCDWYTRVSIFTYYDTRVDTIARVAMNFGDIPTILRFGDPNRGECLTPELMDSGMARNAWHGLWGEERDLLSYTKPGVRVEAMLVGGFGEYPKRYACVSEIIVNFTHKDT